MKRSLIGLLVIVLFPFTAATARAQDAAKGASLLAEARRALGGDEKLAAVNGLDMKAKLKRSAGQNTVEGELEIRVERPDRMRRDEDLSPPGGGPAIVRTEVLNGSDVWDENAGGGGLGGFGGFGGGGGGRRGFGGGGFGGGGRARDQAAPPDGAQAGGPQAGGRGIDPAQLKEFQRRTRQADLARLNLLWLLDTDAPVAWVGTAESPDGKADVLEIQPAGGAATRLFLDQMTHVPLMLTWQGPAAGGRRGRGADQAAQPPQPLQPTTLRMTLGEYKTVNGVKLPHLITRGVNGQTVEEWSVTGYKLNPSFKSDVFKK